MPTKLRPVTVSTHVTVETWERIRDIAKEQERSVSAIARTAILRYLAEVDRSKGKS